MSDLKGFATLKVTKGCNGKFYIYSAHFKTTIGPAFNSLSELEAYANEHYADEYV